jgi:hypothetical protein
VEPAALRTPEIRVFIAPETCAYVRSRNLASHKAATGTMDTILSYLRHQPHKQGNQPVTSRLFWAMTTPSRHPATDCPLWSDR